MQLREALEGVSVEELRQRGWDKKRIKGYLKARGKALKRYEAKVREIKREGVKW